MADALEASGLFKAAVGREEPVERGEATPHIVYGLAVNRCRG